MFDLKILTFICFIFVIYHLLTRRTNEDLNALEPRACAEICKKNFTISYFDIPPYSTHPIIEPQVRNFCGNCARISLINTFIEPLELTSSLLNSSDFIYPFFGSSTDDALLGFHFVPIVNVSNAFFITPRTESYGVRLFAVALRSSPQIIISLLIIMISIKINRVICSWIREHQRTRLYLDEKTIVMTQVYYVIRLLFVLSMLIICVNYCVRELEKVNHPPPPDMIGANVGILRHRKFDMSLLIEHGGVAVESEGEGFYRDILSLIKMLYNKTVDGLLFDQYTLLHAEHGLRWMRSLHLEGKDNRAYTNDIKFVDFFVNETIRVEKTYEGDTFSCGVLLRNKEHFSYFQEVHKVKNITLNATSSHKPVDMKEYYPGVGTVWSMCMLILAYEFARTKLLLSDDVVESEEDICEANGKLSASKSDCEDSENVVLGMARS